MGIDEAKKQGAIAEFGEKYGERVRVVTIGDFSKELCGGTHVHNTAQLGLVKLLGESSIGAGVRRVEALVGVDAYRFLAREHTIVNQLTNVVKGRPEELPERVAGIVAKLREAEKEIDRMRAAQVLQASGSLASQSADVNGVALVAHRVADGTPTDDLRKLALDVRQRLSARPATVAVVSVVNNKPMVVVATNEAARERGVKAGELVRIAAKTLGGGGGGKDDVAQGGGADPGAVEEALAAVTRTVAEKTA
jgi:alanyl-tRNA synthetase